ncbi:MAG: type II secretion system F family protein [Acidimicrobiia bacterium]|nr:type II secretion system F family protein [Acidimicrobiia bacterium]
MIAAPVLAALAVAVLMVAARPRAHPVERLPATGGPHRDHAPRRSPLVALGAAVRRVAHRPFDHDADQRLGRCLAVAVLLAVIDPILAVVWCAGVGAHRFFRRRATARDDRQALVDELPEVVDLLTLAVSAGLTVPLAVGVVADRGSGRVAADLGRALEGAARGRSLPDAVDDALSPLGDQALKLARVLAGAMRDGTSVLPSLERLAAEVRTDRRRAAEERARRLPVRLLFPLVTCVLPAFALLTVVPLLAGAIAGLPR